MMTSLNKPLNFQEDIMDTFDDESTQKLSLDLKSETLPDMLL